MTHRFHCSPQDCRGDRCPAKQVFSGLTPGQDASLVQEMLPRSYATGEIVIHNDTPALAIFAVRSGQVKLVRPTSDGHDIVVGVRGPSSLLGVREVLTDLPFRISVETMEPSVLCALPRGAFLAAVQANPDLSLRLCRQMATDYLTAEEQWVERTQARVVARTARVLFELADGGPANGGASVSQCVSMSRENMAQLVGTARETLSRSLHHLAGRGAVRLESGAIHILDSSLLERCSRG